MAESRVVGNLARVDSCLIHRLGEFLRQLPVLQVLMAQRRHVGVVRERMFGQPPLAQQRSYKRSNQTADVDEHVEDLET